MSESVRQTKKIVITGGLFLLPKREEKNEEGEGMFKFSEDIRESYPDLMDREFSYKQLGEVYRDVVDKNEDSSLENWFYDMRRSDLIQMEMPSAGELRDYARDCSKRICIIENGDEVWRDAHGSERKILYSLIYSGLLAMRDNCHDCDRDAPKIISGVEYSAIVMIEGIQSYLCVYLPIKRFWYGYKRKEN